jgi:hypothetical protein
MCIVGTDKAQSTGQERVNIEWRVL